MTAQLLFSLEDLDGMEPSEGSSGVLRYGVRIMPEEGWVVEGTGLRELYLGDLARENMSGVFLDVACSIPAAGRRGRRGYMVR